MKFNYSIVLLIVLLSIKLSYSQGKELDSLKTLYYKYHKFQDTIRVKLSNQLTKYYTLRDNSKNKAKVKSMSKEKIKEFIVKISN